VKLGISARQPDGIGIRARLLVIERRERKNFSPRRAPTGKNVRVCERERVIARQRDTLARRTQCALECTSGRQRLPTRLCRRDERIEIDGRLNRLGQRVHPRAVVGMFIRLHEAEMALRQAYASIAPQRAKQRQADTF
jgi:hypothetical protein